MPITSCRKLRLLALAAVAGLFGLSSCQESYHYEVPKISGTDYDPTQSVTVTGILPDSGGYKTPFIIEGTNFGTDASKINVVFNGNRKATVVSTNGTRIYGIMPKQEDGLNLFSVQIDSTLDPVVSPVKFRYSKVERVSVLAGKTANGGYVDGSLAESRFNYMYGVNVVTGNNLIVCEGRDNRVRMVSETDNKVTTLYTGANFGHPAVTKDRRRAYVIQIDKPHAIYYFDQSNSWEAKRLTASLDNINGKIYSCALADDDRYLYFRDAQGKFGCVDTQDPSKITVLNDSCGARTGEISYLEWSKVDRCFYLSVQVQQGIYKVSKDGKSVEQWIGFNGVGHEDGSRLTAVIRNPTGMAFDVDGNMYFIDSMGFVVRKLNHDDGMVSTVAGQYQTCVNDKIEGLPLEVTFNFPYDIAVDDAGDFYIIEGWGTDVRKFAIE